MDWRYNTIWTEQLPEAEYAAINFNHRTQTPHDLSGKRYISAAKFKSGTENLLDFPTSGGADYVYIGSSNIKSFTGVSRFGEVKRLEAHYCLKLENDSGLSGLRNSLEWLHINQSKKFTPGEELFSLSRLKVLCLNACGPIHDLEFLYALPDLLDFRFVDTNVISGDLTPLIKHPALCSAGFLNKRHYNLKDTEVDQHLRSRWNTAIEKTCKGSYETYRYTSLGT